MNAKDQRNGKPRMVHGAQLNEQKEETTVTKKAKKKSLRRGGLIGKVTGPVKVWLCLCLIVMITGCSLQDQQAGMQTLVDARTIVAEEIQELRSEVEGLRTDPKADPKILEETVKLLSGAVERLDSVEGAMGELNEEVQTAEDPMESLWSMVTAVSGPVAPPLALAGLIGTTLFGRGRNRWKRISQGIVDSLHETKVTTDEDAVIGFDKEKLRVAMRHHGVKKSVTDMRPDKV